MRKSRRILLVTMLLLVLVGPFQLAIAAPAVQYHVHLTDTSTPWGFPVGLFCPEYPQPMEIDADPFSSDRVKHAAVVTKADGSMHVVVSDLIRGTASDEFGGSYTFVYQNSVTFDFDGSTVYAHMHDTFTLKGPTSYVVGFNWRWAYPADSLEVAPVFDNGQMVDIQITPNLPPTEDGIVEAPWIVPGSWEQMSTKGDPWNCDPL